MGLPEWSGPRRAPSCALVGLPRAKCSASTLTISRCAAAMFSFALSLSDTSFAPSKLDNELLSLPSLAFGDLNNYVRAWNNLNVYQEGVLVRWGLNSVFYTFSSLILSVAVSVPAGYALATSKFKGRRVILWATLITMILPGSALVLPLFLEMNAVRLVDTPWSVILPAAFFPFGVYLAFIYFANHLPGDLLSAGRVDGCSEWQ